MITMTKTQRTRLLKWWGQQSRVCNKQPEVNNYYKKLILYTGFAGHSWHTAGLFYREF